MNVIFLRFKCQTQWRHYQQGAPAMQLVDAESGDLVTTATVNLVDRLPKDGEVFIKDWGAGNAGIVEALARAGVIHLPHDRIPVGGYDAVVKVCRLTVQAEMELNAARSRA